MVDPKVSRPRKLPVEYLIVVGGPCNTFNCYTFVDPVSGDEKGRPKPNTLDDLVKNYLPPKVGQPNPLFIGTHDIYWANFIDPIHRLFTQGHASPRPGDLVTVALFLPPYLARADNDWDASPHNALLHRNSPWVRGKDPYDPLVRSSEQASQKSPQKPTFPIRNPAPPNPNPVVSQARIDHEILMRTTSANTTIIKRPTRPNRYIDIIHDIPRRCVLGSQTLTLGPPFLKNVLVKIIFIRDVAELVGYMAHGLWAGERATHLLDTRSEEDQGDTPSIEQGATYDFHAAGGPPAQAHPFWRSVPVVDRQHVKIQELHYVGHSAPEFWLLQYGTRNDKGEVPVGEVVLNAKDLLDNTFTFGPKPHFTKDAMCKMWGCFTGEPRGMAEQMSALIPTVIACPDATSFEFVADETDRAMPVPSSGDFVEFKRSP